MINIGRQQFKTKKEALTAIRALRDRYEDGEIVNSADFVFLRAVLSLHYDEEKIVLGLEIVRFWVGRDDYGSRAFFFERTDGTKSVFSFLKCLSKRPSHRACVLAAFREEIRPQILVFKESRSDRTCAISGEPLGDSVHVDHVVPFKQLVENFLSDVDLQFREIEIQPGEDAETHARLLKDRELAVAWVEYHEECAELRMTTATANLCREHNG